MTNKTHRSTGSWVFIFLLSSLIFNSPALAQDTAYARKMMDTLCSPYFAGRGYVEDGYKKAAEFVAGQFKEIGLEPLLAGNIYRQRFPMSVNTFPGRVQVGVSKRRNWHVKWLVPGKDYIVDPASIAPKETIYGYEAYEIVKVDSSSKSIDELKPYYSTDDRAITYDPKTVKDLQKRYDQISASKQWIAVELVDGPLVWSVATDTAPVPIIQLRKKVVKKKWHFIALHLDQKFNPYYTSSNVIGCLRNPANPDSFIVIGAHLDHLGKMGKDAMFPGANDNASGTAMMLDMARYFDRPEVRRELKYSIIFISFGGEEAGLLGSKYFVDHSPVELSKIKFMINMDLMGNGQDGMMVVNGGVFKTQYDSLVAMNNRGKYLKEIKSRGKAANSDHYWFSEKGVPSFFFYLLGNYPYYHDIYDTPEKPTLKGYDGAFRLITEFVKSL